MTTTTSIKITKIFDYGKDGVLRNTNFDPVSAEDYSNDSNMVTNLVVKLPGNKSVIMELDMDLLTQI
jgi:hypothetical protein